MATDMHQREGGERKGGEGKGRERQGIVFLLLCSKQKHYTEIQNKINCGPFTTVSWEREEGGGRRGGEREGYWVRIETSVTLLETQREGN